MYARHRYIEKSLKLFLLMACVASHYRRYDGPDRVFAPFSPRKPHSVSDLSGSSEAAAKETMSLREDRQSLVVMGEVTSDGQDLTSTRTFERVPARQ